MSRVIKRLILTLLLGALAAATLLLWLSTDPRYTLQSWLAGGRYYEYDDLITGTARKYRIEPTLLKAIVWRESGFQRHKVGTSGERGLMQVGEAAAQDWAKAEKIETFVPTDLFDAKTNLEVGTWYLRQSLDRWKQKKDPLPFALADYNAGRSRVDRWLAAANFGDEASAEDLLLAIEFPTTRSYIETILSRERFYLPRSRCLNADA
jgi:soluble lytic murein transglycosylase